MHVKWTNRLTLLPSLNRAFVLSKFNIIVHGSHLENCSVFYTFTKHESVSLGLDILFENHHKFPNNGIDLNGEGGDMKIFIPVWKKKTIKTISTTWECSLIFSPKFLLKSFIWMALCLILRLISILGKRQSHQIRIFVEYRLKNSICCLLRIADGIRDASCWNVLEARVLCWANEWTKENKTSVDFLFACFE